MGVLDRGLWHSSSFDVGSDVCRCQALGSCDFIYMKRIGKETRETPVQFGSVSEIEHKRGLNDAAN